LWCVRRGGASAGIVVLPVVLLSACVNEFDLRPKWLGYLLMIPIPIYVGVLLLHTRIIQRLFCNCTYAFCTDCGYDLTALEASVCPECGQHVDLSARQREALLAGDVKAFARLGGMRVLDWPWRYLLHAMTLAGAALYIVVEVRSCV